MYVPLPSEGGIRRGCSSARTLQDYRFVNSPLESPLGKKCGQRCVMPPSMSLPYVQALGPFNNSGLRADQTDTNEACFLTSQAAAVKTNAAEVLLTSLLA